MHVETLVVGEFQVNCFLVWSEPRQAIVIDPGADANRIACLLKEQGLGVAAYVLTHGHVDHVSGLADLYDEFPAPVAMHPADLTWAFTAANHMLPFYPAPRPPTDIARRLQDGQACSDGGLDYRVLSTPGHTPGCVCLHFAQERAVFTGDTLFAGSVGRTDLPRGDARQLTASLARLARLAPETAVYPGHGPKTDLGQEQRTNYFMQSMEVSK